MGKKNPKNRALNAFSIAVDDETYIKGLRQQQDIDLEHIADDNIRNLLNGEVDSDDDDDINSDEAVGDSDISLNEPESSGEEDNLGDSLDESELRPLSEIWDLDSDSESQVGSPDTKKESKATRSRQDVESGESEDESGSKSEDSDAESEDSSSGSDSDEDGSRADSEDLGEDIFAQSDDSEDDGDDGALQKAVAKVASGKALESHRLRVDAGAENPFALPSSNADEVKLTLEELGVAVSSKKQKKLKPLDMPLPKRAQEREDRAAALELTKEEVSKWEDTVKMNRRAEHLQFPMKPKQLEPATPFVSSKTAQNSLEADVSNILQQSALADEKAAQTFEDMAPSTLTFEELRERRNKLRQMRELMFREEQRAKRIKKIKSKSYRRVHKKEREKMEELNSDADEDEDDVIRKRAMERATLRHKSSSKWAKRMADQGMTGDAETRAEMEDMLRQSDQLRKKVMGDDDDNDESGNLEEGDDIVSDTDHTTRKGVLGMKFMIDAEKKQREENNKLLRDDYDEPESTNIGRKSFNPAGQQLKRDLEEQESDGELALDRLGGNVHDRQPRNKSKKLRVGEEEVVTVREKSPGKAKAADRTEVSDPGEFPEESNPWLQLNVTKGKSTFTSVGANSSKQEKAAANLAKQKEKAQSSKKKDVSIELVDTLLGDSLIKESDLTIKQKDLVRRAFAGDDVATEFEEEKRQIIEDDGDKEIDETLPGWGSWSNDKPRVQKIRRVKGIAENQRRDAKKKDVIINEKINKKASKYSASAVPFPFENRAQYERSLRMPIGQEWVSKDTFQRQTKPRVLVKRGEIIDPLDKPKR